MFFKYYLSIVVIFLFFSAPLCFGNHPICRVYSAKGLPIQNAKIGEDLGANAPDEGYYDCKLLLNRNKIDNLFLYIGEVGDASYIKFYNINGVSTNIIKRHGLSSLNSVYMRIIPFFVPLDEFFSGEGTYSFRVYYKNLLKPFQVGIRSGPIEILSFEKLLIRIFKDFFKVIYCVIQFFAFFLLLLSTVQLRFISLENKIKYFFLCVFCMLSILSVSGIPRFFLNLNYIILSNQILVIIMYSLFGMLFKTLFISYSKANYFFYTPLFLGFVSIFLVVFNGSNITTLTLPLSVAVIPTFNIFFVLFTINYNLAFFKSSFRIPSFLYFSFLLIILVYFFDAYNIFFLNSKYNYLSHYFGIFYFLFFISYFYKYESDQIVIIKKKLELIKMDLLNSLAQQNDDMTIRISQFFKEVSALLNTDYARLSIVGKKNSVAYLYDYGANQMVLVPFEQKDKKNPSLDFSFDVPNYNVKFELTRKNSKIFTNDILNLRDELFSFSSMFFGILFAQKTLNEKNQLLSMMRGRVHPHQTLSEEYFLENFEFSTTLKTHALIRGDLVGSTSLNEVYGAKMIEEIIDKYFLELFEKYKDQGIILNRLNGDEVYFIFPALSLDTENSQCVEKCYLFLQDINSHEQSLAVISKERGVFMPLRYRFVMNTADNLKSDVALKSMNQVADGELDAMKRVLDYVAAEGECVVMENAFNLLTDKNELIELSPQRLRGKLKNIRLFSLGKKT